MEPKQARKYARQALSDGRTKGILASVGITEGMACLELGAGFGSIAGWLASQTGPLGRVVATERKPDCLAALDRLACSLLALEVSLGDIEAGPIEGPFDLVVARYVFEHLEDPGRALDHAAGSLRAGGLLVLEDADFTCVRNQEGPVPEALVRFAESARPSNLYLGRSLPALLTERKWTIQRCIVTPSRFRGASCEASFWAMNLEEKAARIRRCATDPVRVRPAIEALADASRWFVGPSVVSLVATRPESAGGGPS